MRVVDANVLLYAVNPAAALHARAERGSTMRSAAATPWGSHGSSSSPSRIGTSPAAFPRPLTVDEAVGIVDLWLAQRAAVVISPTSRHLGLLHGLLSETGSAANLVNDAHLAALASSTAPNRVLRSRLPTLPGRAILGAVNPYWLEDAVPRRPAHHLGHVDVAIVGAGITGCSAALRLAEAGLRRARARQARRRRGCERPQRRLRAERRRDAVRRRARDVRPRAGARAVALDGGDPRPHGGARRRRAHAAGQLPARRRRGGARADPRGVRGAPRGRDRRRVDRRLPALPRRDLAPGRRLHPAGAVRAAPRRARGGRGRGVPRARRGGGRRPRSTPTA